MNLAEKYNHVCRECPEAKIDGLNYSFAFDDWIHVNVAGYIHEPIAQALIENAWTKILLARGYDLTQTNSEPRHYSFVENWDEEFTAYFPTILEAAAARLAPEKM